MNSVDMDSVDISPAEAVDRMDAQSTRFETPCGEGSMVWRKWGKGPPLVLFHGGHGTWTHWIRNIPHFAERYTVWAPDLPGFGESATPERKDSGDFIAEIIATGLRQLLGNEAPLDIVAFSFGGVLSTYLAAIAPELVRRLILVDPGGIGTPLGDFEVAPLRGLTDPDEILAAHRRNLLSIMIRHPENADPLAVYLQATNIPLGRINPVPVSLPDLCLKALTRSSTPVDAIWGELDAPHPNPEGQRAALASVRPDLNFRVVKDAGHWNMYEQPGRFNRALDELLALRPRKDNQ